MRASQSNLLNNFFLPVFLYLIIFCQFVLAQDLNPMPSQIWKCGKLLTNRMPQDKEEGAKSECQSITPPLSSVTLEGPKSQARPSPLAQGLESSSQKEKVTNSEGQNPLVSKTLRDEQSKQILTSERDRLKERQKTLDELLGGTKLSEAELSKLNSEKERNGSDLKGIEREISRLH